MALTVEGGLRLLFFCNLLIFLTNLQQLEPENTEDYIDYLKSVGWLDEAATRLAFIVNKVEVIDRLLFVIFHVAKCNLGEVKLETMLASSLPYDQRAARRPLQDSYR